MKTTAITISILLTLGACRFGDSSPWVWKVDGRKFSVKQMEDAYDGFFFFMAQSAQMSPEQLKEQLKKFKENPDAVRPEIAAQFREMNRESFAERYKQIILVNQEAKKNGYLKDERVKSRLQFVKQYLIANAYLMDSLMKTDVKISDEEAVVEWEKIRRQYPRMKAVPVDEGIEIARNQIKMKTLQLKQQEFMKTIAEAYKIESNPNFDLKAYLRAEDGLGGDKQDEEPEEEGKKKKKKKK